MNTFFHKIRLYPALLAFVCFITATFALYGTAGAAPKALNLTTFKTSCGRGMVIVHWATDMERFTVGYHIYRSTSKSAVGERLNTAMIPQNGGNGAGSYFYNDTNVQVGTVYFYTVEEIALNGSGTLHGPVSGTLNCTLNGRIR